MSPVTAATHEEHVRQVGRGGVVGHGLGRAVRDRYRSERWTVRRYVAIRWALCPYAALATWVPPEGLVLDLGCGIGHWPLSLALERPGRNVVGIDWDADRVALARRVGRTVSNIRFEVGDIADPVWWSRIADGSVRALTCIDVLYLMPYRVQHAVLSQIHRVLAPDGVALIKQMSRRPAWKWHWYHWQERLAVHVLGWTKGRGLWCEPLLDDPSAENGAGWLRRLIRLDRGFAYPHELVVVRRQPDLSHGRA